MSNERAPSIWWVVILALLAALALGVSFRLALGTSSRAELAYGTRPFVPAESPYSTGPESR